MTLQQIDKQWIEETVYELLSVIYLQIIDINLYYLTFPREVFSIYTFFGFSRQGFSVALEPVL